jgi:NAD(P)-dependent dehydrogenase (short-subunit alcohol dehydrogenase family)
MRLGIDLDGRVVIVTGAGSGIGAQFVAALCGAGARVVLAGRREERLRAVAADAGGETLVVPGDVADADDRAALVEAAVDRFGRVDGLVNNAGAADIAPALRQETAAFARLVDVNLVAPYALACAAAARMRHTGGGSIVNIASVAGIRPLSWQPHAGYVASKTGLIGLTRELASQWGRYDIRVNGIAPGPFTSEMTGDAYEVGDEAARMVAGTALQRIGRPGELDGLLLLLLHPASAYLTGQTIAVDGGLSATI